MSGAKRSGVEAAGVDRCPTCSATGTSEIHRTLCAYSSAMHADVVRRAAEYGISNPSATDLWAHLNGIYGEVARAHKAVLNVIDLGWRPVVGSAGTWKAE